VTVRAVGSRLDSPGKSTRVGPFGAFDNPPGFHAKSPSIEWEEVSTSMAGVRVKESEPIESAIRRFKKQCEKAGILAELRKREHYEKPSVRRKKKALAAKKRLLRRAARSAY